MALILKVGLSEKRGLPNYGSLGVSCHLDIELDPTLLPDGLDAFQAKVRQAYATCQQAVQDELNRHKSEGSNGSTADLPRHRSSPLSPNGQAVPVRSANGHPREQPRPATSSQVRALEAIARQQHLDLPILLHRRYDVGTPSDLSIVQASRLIDDLKAAAGGSGGDG